MPYLYTYRDYDYKLNKNKKYILIMKDKSMNLVCDWEKEKKENIYENWL